MEDIEAVSTNHFLVKVNCILMQEFYLFAPHLENLHVILNSMVGICFIRFDLILTNEGNFSIHQFRTSI